MMQNKLNMFKKLRNMSLTLITIRINVKPISYYFSHSDWFMRADYLIYFERHSCNSELAEFIAFKIIE